MKKMPTYDWDWFISHAPFKKIITEYCDLDVKKEVKRFAVCCGIWDTSNEYEITVSLKKFEDNFEEIKAKLLNTNVCKKNKEIFDYVNELKFGKYELCCLIMDGCIANCEGRFKWNWCEEKDYSAFDNPTAYEKTVIDRLRADGLDDVEIAKCLREL